MSRVYRRPSPAWLLVTWPVHALDLLLRLVLLPFTILSHLLRRNRR